MTEKTYVYCTFRSAGRWFGTPIGDVTEVAAETNCAPIPHAPPEVAGYVNIRGHIFLALDLRRLLGWDAAVAAESRLVLFKPSVGPSFGILVDEIRDIAEVEASRIDEFSAAASELTAGEPISRAELITKICRCPTELLLVLDPQRFLPVVENMLSEVA